MELITLGDHKIPVVAQRHARLRHYLGNQDFTVLMSREYGPEAYRLLSILVPTLSEAMPLWEWDGYASAEDMEKGHYQEELDKSPTTDEIAQAFETVLSVNGVGRLGKVIDILKLGLQQNGNRAPETPTSSVLPGVSGA